MTEEYTTNTELIQTVDKLMDFAKDTFSLALYGLQDVFSGHYFIFKTLDIKF